MVVPAQRWKIALLALIATAVALTLWYFAPWSLLAGAAFVGVGGAAFAWRRRRAPRQRVPDTRAHDERLAAATQPEDAEDTGDLIDQMLQQGRYALLLRPQIVANLAQDQAEKAAAELDTRMALVPDGDVILKATRYETDDGQATNSLSERVVRVEPMYLDRHPVTNRQFKAFVKAGGYEQISLWDPSVWPAILDFVDSTGHPGPRYWKNGTYLSGEAEHPVVGVSWYEACAYARWVGKRLPTDPEWVKAGGWPVQVPGGKPIQRKHPWGDTPDRTQANLWGSGPGRTVPVHEMNNGGSVGGVYQLIGNVWEWTTSNFGAWDAAARRIESPTQMKSLRGGAFDTYFDAQANCQFQSGDSPMSRKHNIGFRCALSMCDLGQFPGISEEAEPAASYHETTQDLAEAVV